MHNIVLAFQSVSLVLRHLPNERIKRYTDSYSTFSGTFFGLVFVQNEI